MDEAGDGGQTAYDQSSTEQSPSLLTIVLDTNPAAWALLHDTLSISQTIANLLIFINAHLACNYTNQVAVIASHCDKASWLYPTGANQKPPGSRRKSRKAPNGTSANDVEDNGTHSNGNNGSAASRASSHKYRPFRLIEEEILTNLTALLTSTVPASIQAKTSTMIAGALTLALSYINRRTTEHTTSLTGNPDADPVTSTAAGPTESSNAVTNALQSRILLLMLSPSTDLAHQYIPMMNSIFACQRLSIPIDVLQLPLPGSSYATNQNSTVFLQQAADATKGIFIPAQLTPASTSGTATTTSLTPQTAPTALLTYLLSALLPSPSTRRHLILPTRIDVDFRAACFCHRNIISTGYVCSICLSIFCEESLAAAAETARASGNGGNDQGGVGWNCLTCGTDLRLGEYGAKPIVVAKRRRRRRRD